MIYDAFFRWLAVLDVLCCAMYVILFTCDYIWVEFGIFWLYHAWNVYVLEAYTVSHIGE